MSELNSLRSPFTLSNTFLGVISFIPDDPLGRPSYGRANIPVLP